MSNPLLAEIWSVCSRHTDFWDDYSEGSSDLAVSILNLFRKYEQVP